MPRYSEDPVRHIISFRSNSEEKKLLEELAERTHVSISTYVRKAIGLVAQKESLWKNISS